MTNEGTTRKLIAILSADAVGYSRLMAEDEVGTVDRLKSYRELISTRVREHHGRVIDSPGDNILAEFPSALDAARSAIEIQRVLKTRNDDLPDERKMDFRIGIHLGDVMVDDDRIYGDGVNIAARLESLADPGGICISDMIHRQVKGKLDIEFKDIGLQTVKNIPEPVRVYKIQTASKAFAEPQKEKNFSVISEKPSIAVLPFVNMSNDPDQEYFSDGMAEEILNGLAKNSGMIVKARTSSFSTRVKDQDARTIGDILNVTHILEGSVRKAGNRIRVTAQLISATEDAHIWSDRYDRELTDIFEIQDEIADSILKELNIHLVGLPDKHKATTNMEAYNAYLLGRYHYNRGNINKVLNELEKAVSLDPNNPDIYGLLSTAQVLDIVFDRKPTAEILPIIRKYMHKALSLNPKQIDALIVRLFIHFFEDHIYQDALNECADLIRQYANNSDILCNYSTFFSTFGMLDLTFRVLDRALALDPLSPLIYSRRGFVFHQTGNFDEARKSYEKAEMLGMNSSSNLASIAFSEGDLLSLQKVLDRGTSNWGHWYYIYQAAASYMKGDQKKIKEILSPLWQTKRYLSFYSKSCMAVLEGNLDLAMDYY